MIFLTGDTHRHNQISKIFSNKIKDNDKVIILGDFGGIWYGKEKDKDFFRLIEENCKGTILFIDGNHENFVSLYEDYPVIDKYNGKVRQISDRIFHLMRGEIYTIEGKTFFCFGGAKSVDKIHRIEFLDYWREELPNKQEEDYALNNLEKVNYQVDYVLTHSAPSFIVKPLFKNFKESSVEKFLEHLSYNLKYKKWFFGHYHLDADFDEKHSCLFLNLIPLE